ncbi:MAG: ThiF family adenylyltransferase [Deltaproteobacteria bacterium]|nr:ThiF family adenylyltransferase [Deltaproteobacteria bacterium]
MNTAESIIAGAQDGVVSSSVLAEVATKFALPLLAVEKIALINGVIPRRYYRNIGTITPLQQLSLLDGRCVLLGCGGLGGYVAEALARLGVGYIRIVDHDIFSESNLNRQLFAITSKIGFPKVTVVQEAIEGINSAIKVTPYREKLRRENAVSLLADVDIVIDALDNFEARSCLLSFCSAKGVPIVGGSIAGWYGMIYHHISPPKNLLQIFTSLSGHKGIEEFLGNPSFTPALVASIQVALVCQIITGAITTGGLIQFLDVLNMKFEKFEI